MQKGNQMRYSKQRELIQEIVRMNSVHPSADWIYEKAKKIIPNISLGTVYRNLNQLVDNKSLKTVQHNGVVHYDGNTDSHSHFICDICSGIYDFYPPIDEMISSLNKTSSHIIAGGQFQMTGICESCKTSN